MGKEFEMNCTKEPLEMKLKRIKSRGMQGYEEVMGKGLKTNCKANRLQKKGIQIARICKTARKRLKWL